MPSSVLRSVQFCSVLLFPQFSRAYVIFIPYKIATSRSNNILPSTSHTSHSSSFFLFSLFFPDFSVPKKKDFLAQCEKDPRVGYAAMTDVLLCQPLEGCKRHKGSKSERKRQRQRNRVPNCFMCPSIDKPNHFPQNSFRLHTRVLSYFTRVLLVENTWIE